MSKRIKIRLGIILALTLLSVYFFAGAPPTLEHMKQRIHLGLDLQGGIQLVLKVKTDDAIRAETDQTIESLKTQLQKENITFRPMVRTQDDQFTATGVDPAKSTDFKRIMSELHSDWDVSSTSTDPPNSYLLQLKQVQAAALRQQAVDQALSTISNRINYMGVTEPTIQRRGTSANSDQILIQFPGIKDPGHVEEIIQSTALLELKLVEGTGGFPSEEQARQQYGGVIPADLELLPSVERSADGGTIWYVVHKSGGITGRDMKSAVASRDANNRPDISFSLNSDGAQRFSVITGQNIGKLLAIILDGRIQSAPRLDGQIRDQGQITGGFTVKEAEDLALKLRSGALPAGIDIEEKTVVSATLGADSVKAGVTASLVALVAVLAFVLIYYKFSGVNAAVAMFLNLIVLLGAMAAVGSTMTLPGIAGVILTIGVGIDSNVLIFERIREEMRSGKNAASAVLTSFNRVFITLVDTHLAALISATFLFVFGTGPVKGFAVTLVIGLVSNMFTAVFVSRTLFEIVLSRKEAGESISI
jgi:preprotein translocase subunit SecD